MASNIIRPANSHRQNHGIVVSGHYIQNYGYHTNRTAGDKDWFMTFTLDGRGFFQIGESVKYCRRGDLTVMPPGVPQHYGTSEGHIWNFMWVHFRPPSHWELLLRNFKLEQRSGLFHLHLDKQELVEDINRAFDRILKFQYNNTPLSLNGVEEVLLRINHYLGGTKQLLDPRIKEVLNYMAEHLGESHSIDILANKVYLSASRLRHLFKKEVGEPLLETLTKMRLQQAARLLELTSMTIAEIAGEVGFQSAFYFTSRFTEHFGMNPSTYRKKHKMDQ